ncbi:MAG: hypothetical protein AB1746_11440 [Candidatus Zixiibacteriota bacterium]
MPHLSNQKGAMSRGCVVALIVFGIIFVLIVASMLVCYIYRDDIFELGITKLAETVAAESKKELPSDITAEDVDKAVEDLKTAFKEKKIGSDDITSLSLMFQEIMKDQVVDSSETRQFVEEITRVTRSEPPTDQTEESYE